MSIAMGTEGCFGQWPPCAEIRQHRVARATSSRITTEVESGKRSDRPEFTKAADYAELANAIVLVAKLDRLSRDLHFITSLQKRGIRFKLADLPEIDQLTIHILAAMAEHKARMISTRTKQALAITASITR